MKSPEEQLAELIADINQLPAHGVQLLHQITRGMVKAERRRDRMKEQGICPAIELLEMFK